ncbi:MAG: pyridoxal phosphate-dependent aminotransferase [Firmicutes bacterium]|nr:pyridoxal phosphate-dependent aminotransferase [Bacillota bacterium]
MRLSERVRRITPSSTLAMDARAKQMQREGQDVVFFGVGEPDFDTPEFIKDEAVAALRAGMTKYAPAAGLADLREAVCQYLYKEYGLSYRPKNIVITCGAKHALYNVFQVILEPGDEVILPVPYWVSYSEQIKLAGGVVVPVMTTAANGFRMQPEDFAAAITPRTRAVVINSPNNPTGAVYSRAELLAIAEIAVRHDLVIVSDEIYDHLIYDGLAPTSIPTLGPEVAARTILINGVSKTYAMTGWRIGYAAGDEKVIAAMADLQSHSSNATTFCQKAAIKALLGPQEAVEKMRAEFARRRDLMVRLVRETPGLDCLTPQGAFYVFVDVGRLIGRTVAGETVRDDEHLAEIFLEKAKVAVVPGAGFGMPNYIRLSYATSCERIEEGFRRIKALLAGG